MKNYKGYTNRITWIIKEEIFNDIKLSSEIISPSICKRIANDVIFDNQEISGVALTVLLQSLKDVNWEEICQSINNSK